MMLLDPRFWLSLIVAIAIGYLGGCQQNDAEHKAKADAEIAKIENDARDRLDAANDRVREASRFASQSLVARDAAHHKEQNDAKNNIDRLRAQLRTGAVRLSVPANPAGNPASSRDSATAGSPGTETRAELDRATAEALVTITADGDAAIIQLNAVIDAYEVIRTACMRQLIPNPQLERQNGW